MQEGDEKPTGEKSSVARIQKAYFEGEELKAFKHGAGIDTPAAAPPAVKESSSLDVAGVVQAQSALVGTLITQIVDLVKVKPTAGEDPLMKFLLEELRDMRAKADNAPDPLAYLFESQERLGAISQKLKASLGLGEGVRVGTQDIGGMISLEEAKMEREERQRRWETERDMTTRQYERENQRWNREFDLKLAEFKEGQANRQNTTDMFGDLIGSVVEALNIERGVTAAGQAPPHPTPAPTAATPVEAPPPPPFECPECHNQVTPPASTRPGQELKCPHCEAFYRMQVA